MHLVYIVLLKAPNFYPDIASQWTSYDTLLEQDPGDFLKNQSTIQAVQYKVSVQAGF